MFKPKRRQTRDPGIRALCIDGGGIRALSQLIVLQEFMSRIQADQQLDEIPLVCECFEIIGGTGSGALIAILLGRLCLTVEQAIKEFIDLSMLVFTDRKDPKKDDAFKCTKLELAIQGILKRSSLPADAKLLGNDKLNGRCKVIVCATPTADLEKVHLFRNYKSRLATPSIDTDCTIVEAIRASMASHSFFKPIFIGPKGANKNTTRALGQEFVGGSLRCNNPTRILLKEARNAFGNEQRIACVLNVGSGKPQILSLKEGTQSLDGVVRVLEEIAIDCENEAEQLADQFAETGVYFRFSVDRGLETVGLNEWRDFGKVETHTKTYLETGSTTRMVDLCLQSLNNRIGSITLQQLTQSASSVTQFRGLPPLTPYFVMRPQVWEAMVHALIDPPSYDEPSDKPSSQKIFILSGMGGCGKTQITLKFAKEHQTKFSHVFFLDGSSEATIKGDLQAAIRSLGTGFSQQSSEDALAWLARRDSKDNAQAQTNRNLVAILDWLIIFDNVDDPNIDLSQFFPKSQHGCIIVTTRNRDLAQLATTTHWHLGPMADDEAVMVLLKAAHRPIPNLEARGEKAEKAMLGEVVTEEPGEENQDYETALAIVQELGNLPVALVQAGSYAFRMHCFGDYLSLYRKNRARLLRDKATSQLDQYNHSVYATIDTSYAALSDSAKSILHICSFFHNGNIPRAIFAIAAGSNFEYERERFDVARFHSIKEIAQDLRTTLYDEDEWNDVHFHETIHQLVVFSLVSIVHTVNNESFLYFHPLVHSWARDTLSRDDAFKYRAMAARILVCATDSKHWMLHRYLTTHIIELIEYGDLHPNDNAALADILTESGAYEQGLELRREVKRACRVWNGEEHLSTMEAAALLATGYIRQGSWLKGVEIAQEVVEFKRDLYGADHEKTLKSERELGYALHQAGKWKEAEALQTEVLNKYRRLLGSKDLHTIQAAADLAHTYIQQGKWKESKALAFEVHEERRKSLGTEHPDTILASSNLALIYYETNRWKEALVLEEEVLILRKKVLGPEHPDTLDAMNNIAATYSQLDRWEEAEAIEEEVFKLRKKLFGEGHPDTVSASNNLAVTYREMGKLDKAEELLVDAYGRRCKAFGEDHPDVMHPLANLTLTLGLQGRVDEAKKLAVTAAKMLKDSVNETNHPVFRKTLHKIQAILGTDTTP